LKRVITCISNDPRVVFKFIIVADILTVFVAEEAVKKATGVIGRLGYVFRGSKSRRPLKTRKVTRTHKVESYSFAAAIDEFPGSRANLNEY
jgi:hypothetical protein